jgi:uncharacterized membrane protein YfcA
MELIASVGLPQLLMVAVVVVFAAILRAFTGFGFGLAAVPVFALLMSPEEAVVLSVSLTLAVSLLTVKTYWGKAPLRPMASMLALAVVGTVIGAALLTVISPREFRLWIGSAVILACFALGYYRPGRYQPGAALGGLAGFGAGLLNGAFAIPGPPVIIYTMATEPDPARSRAFLLTFFLFMAAAGLLTYAAAGFVTAASPLYFLLAFPAMFIGDKLGYRLFQRYGTAGYRRVAVILLFVMGVAITAEALWW